MTQAKGDGPADDRVIVGRISGIYGVKGWVRIYSYTDPRENIVQYNPWQLKLGEGWRAVEVEDGRRQGKGVIAKLVGCDDRDTAARYMNTEIGVLRSQLPAVEDGEYYWNDLIGLRVVNADGSEFGIVDHLLETGANDVLVVKGERERLIPYLPGEVVTKVDLVAGEMHVDWDPEF